MGQVILILFISLTVAYGQIVFPGEEKGKAVGKTPVPRPVGPPLASSFGSPQGRVQFGEDSVKLQNEPLSDEPIDLAAQNDHENPQARFLPGLFGGGGLFGNGGGFGKGGGGFGKGGGLFGGLANIFNPCSRCEFDDLRFANICCQRGEVQCCGYLGGGGFGHYGGGFGHGGIKGGLGVKPVGPPGYIPGGIGGGVGGIGGLGGIDKVGGGHGGFGGFKHGYCPKPHLFEGFFGRSSIHDDEKRGNKISFRTADEKQIISNEGEFKREKRQTNEHQIDEHLGDEAQREGLQARFLPGLTQIPIFCRDECFSDYDCPGHLKCCMNFRNCRDCARPILF